MPDPLIALMRAATATKTLEIGTAILLAAERHPLHLAKEIASLDSYSHGRFHFGIGAGWNREECEILGVDFDHRWGQVREAIEVMKTCWVEDESEYHGKYYDFPAVKCFPKPAQRPHPPIYLPSVMFDDHWSKRVFKRIVEWGDGWLPVVAECGAGRRRDEPDQRAGCRRWSRGQTGARERPWWVRPMAYPSRDRSLSRYWGRTSDDLGDEQRRPMTMRRELDTLAADIFGSASV